MAFSGLFELFVHVLATADETYRRHTEPAEVHCPFCGLDESGVVREAEIVVGAEVEDLTAADFDFGALGRADNAFGLVETGLANGVQLILQVLFQFSVHGFMFFELFRLSTESKGTYNFIKL